jgi:hypothetical protein
MCWWDQGEDDGAMEGDGAAPPGELVTLVQGEEQEDWWCGPRGVGLGLLFKLVSFIGGGAGSHKLL